MKLSHLIPAVLLLVSLSLGNVAFAQTTPIGGGNPGTTGIGGGNPGTSASQGGGMLVNPIKVNSLPELLKVVIDALLEIGVIVLILAFVWVGFSFVRAQGKAEDLKKARSAFVWTVIGGAILLGAKAIATLVESTVQAL